jgi:cell division protein FtsQ
MAEELSAFAKKRKAKKIRRTIFLVVLLLALLGTCAYFALENYFVVKKVAAQKTDIYPQEQIFEVCNIKKGTPLYKLKSRAICRAVEEEFPYLENVKLKFKLPDQVQITFTEDFGEISVQIGNEVFAIDRDLNVLAKETGDSGISRIRLISGDIKTCFVGGKITFIDEDTAEILSDWIQLLEKKKMLSDVNEIDVSDQFNLKMNYLNRFEILLGDQEDMELKHNMILGVIEDLAPEAAGKIDISNPNNAYVKLNDPI